ncbi:MAG: replicative DNA helicase [Thermoleophilia bacterium]|nr:replicative DNA helicase [Thermoleophilia bacterium]
MLVSDPAVNRVIDDARLNAGDFYLDRHRLIYTVMLELYSSDKPCDELSVNEALTSAGLVEEVGGKNYVSELAAKVPAPGNASHYARIVQENALLRRLLDTSHQIGAWVNEREGSGHELSERAEQLLFEVAHKEQSGDFRVVRQVIDDEVARLEKIQSGELKETGVPSGFKHLDGMTGGFQPSNLIIIAARPSVGKSAFVANIAENVAIKEGRPVAFFSLEMSEIELAQRFIASQSGVYGDNLRRAKISERDWRKIAAAGNKLDTAPLWVDVTSDLSLLDLRAKARRLHIQEMERGGLGLIIVDYLQLMRMDETRTSMVEKVGQISRGLKLLANELEVPVIALSQLSRASENRPISDRRPLLSDLRDSGNIEQDADLVAFLYREDVYRQEAERDGSAEVIIAKHRNGPIGKSELTFLPHFPKFADRAPDHPTGEGSPAAERARAEQA